ncbi:MAG: S-layer homology domain-containing protein [Kovacikia sp.]
MNFSKVVTIVTLWALSGASFVGAFLGIFNSQSNRPDSPTDDKNAAKPDPKTQKAKPTTQPAIATPEKLLNQQLASKPKPQNSAQAAQKSARTASRPAYFQTSRASVKQDLPTARAASEQEPLPTNSTRSTGAIAAPEAISSAQSISAKQREQSADASQAFTVPLTDIDKHSAQYYIESLAAKGIIRGFPDGSFRPNQQITPSEFAIMTRNAFQNSSTAPTYYDLQFHTTDGIATRADAAAYIYQILSKSEPALIVTQVEVQGEVVRPGSYSLAAASDTRLGKGNDFPTVTRAIQQAGGTLAAADLHQVEIHRITEMGSKRVIKVDLSKIFQTGDRTQDLVLQQNDQLVIPSAVSTIQPAIALPEKLSDQPKSPAVSPRVPLESLTDRSDPN